MNQLKTKTESRPSFSLGGMAGRRAGREPTPAPGGCPAPSAVRLLMCMDWEFYWFQYAPDPDAHAPGPGPGHPPCRPPMGIPPTALGSNPSVGGWIRTQPVAALKDSQRPSFCSSEPREATAMCRCYAQRSKKYQKNLMHKCHQAQFESDDWR